MSEIWIARIRLTLIVLGSTTVATARADRILLRGGGEIRGVVLPAGPDSDGPTRVLTATSSRPLELQPSQVVRIVEEPDDPLHEYLKKSPSTAANGPAQVELAEWCEANGLTGPALIHYQNAVDAAPDNAIARKKLGHIYHNGVWMTSTEQKKAQGLILYKGRWLSPDEKRAVELQEGFASSQQGWMRRLTELRRQWMGPDAGPRGAAEAELATLSDPAAAAPLVRVFGSDSEAVRVRMTQWLAAIPGDGSREQLIQVLLNEQSDTVRQAALQELDLRKDDETIPRLIQALRSKDLRIVSRAAWALGTMGAEASISNLISALVKVETRTVMEPGGLGGAGVGGAGLGVTFANVGPGPILPAGGAVGAVSGSPGATVAAGPGFANGSSIPVLTGPYVGDGVVAYGATSIPFGDFAGFAMGGANPNAPRMRDVTNVYRNEAVLIALRKLTNADFGYDPVAWRRWFASEFRPDAPPDRRVPQP